MLLLATRMSMDDKAQIVKLCSLLGCEWSPESWHAGLSRRGGAIEEQEMVE